MIDMTLFQSEVVFIVIYLSAAVWRCLVLCLLRIQFLLLINNLHTKALSRIIINPPIPQKTMKSNFQLNCSKLKKTSHLLDELFNDKKCT